MAAEPATEAAAEAAAEKLPVTVYCDAPQSEPGQYLLAVLDCPDLNVHRAQLVLDVAGNSVKLVSGCGCLVHVPLSTMLFRLGAAAHVEHAPACGVH